VALDVLVGTNDDDVYTFGSSSASRAAPDERIETDAPGIVFLEIDGLALPVLQRAMRDGNAPTMAAGSPRAATAGGVGDRPLVADRGEPGGHPARVERGHPRLPLGREGDGEDDDLLGARRLREIERGTRPAGPARRRRRQPRQPPLGEADHMILTVSRMDAEKRANPGYRAFLANGFNARARSSLFGWEVVLEWRRRARRSGATCARAAIAAGSIRSCARRCACSCAT
jgi:hypothetical protein